MDRRICDLMDRYIIREFSKKASNVSDVMRLIDEGKFRQAANEHPLRSSMHSIVCNAMQLVRTTRLHDRNLVDCISDVRGNIGSMIGTLFEYYIGEEVAPHGYTPQQAKHDCDFVFQANRAFDFEVKTSSTTGIDVYGNRTAALATHKTGSFLLAIKYNVRTLHTTTIRFGWVRPCDWIQQRGVGQQSRLSAECLGRFVIISS